MHVLVKKYLSLHPINEYNSFDLIMIVAQNPSLINYVTFRYLKLCYFSLLTQFLRRKLATNILRLINIKTKHSVKLPFF